MKTVKQIFLMLFLLAIIFAGSCVSTPATSEGDIHYNIGDIGPAGGIIFYDKGNNRGGWRYLEAAPEEAEFQAPFSTRRITIEFPQMSNEIGHGKLNTQKILETLTEQGGEWDVAAQLCDELELNGFDDWYLPNNREMTNMYLNLKNRNLGGLYNDIYWTSNTRSDGTVVSANFDFSGRDGSNVDYRQPTERNYVRPIRQVPGPNR